MSTPRLTVRLAAALTALAMPAALIAQEAATLPALATSALRTHESIGRADSNLRRADARSRLARSVLLPSLELNGASTWYEESASLDFGDGQAFELRPSNDWSWSADLRQTLFYGLRDWRAKDVARLERDIARLDRSTAANDLVLEVAAGFLQALSDQERVAVARAIVEQVASQLAVAERRFEVGETAAADVARWRAEHAASRQALIVAEGAAELSLRRLARLAGIDRVEALAPLGPVPPPAGDDRTLVAEALERRLEMRAFEHQLEAAGLYLKIEKGAWLPEVEAHGQYFQQKAEFPSPDWTSIAVTARVPIYDGGLTSARVAAAKEDLRQVELLGRELAKGIADQVEAAAIRHRSAEAAYDAARERLDAAREAQRQVEAAYRVGEASATDLLATTSDLTDAETATIIARAQRELQAIALRHASGLAPLPNLDPMAVLDAPTQE
jgi:outer membrane protein TolC